MKQQNKSVTLIKDDLIDQIARETGIIQADVELVLGKAIAVIRKRVSMGHEVRLKEFGVFRTRIQPSKIARNLQGPVNGRRKNPEPLVLPARTVPHFKPSKKFLQAA